MKKLAKFAMLALPVVLVVGAFLVVPTQGALAIVPADTNTGGSGIDTGGVNVPSGQALTLREVTDLITHIVNILLTIGIVIGIGFIAIGAIQYVFARGDATKAKTARTAIINGLIGIGVILAIGVLLNTVSAIVHRTFFNA